ncbi:hypothetical protein ACA910_009242 [Epithemia clementina (nom. ined.)]
MSGKRPSPTQRRRGRPLSDGSGYMSDDGLQPSRRSSRHRVPTNKVEPDTSKMVNQPRSENGQDLGDDCTTQQYRTRGALATNNDSEEHLELQKSTDEAQSQPNTRAEDYIDDKKSLKFDQNIKEDEDDHDEAFISMIEESTEHVLRLDPKTCNEQILMDADLLLKRILLPMCFPWCHKSALPVKSMARDIDELPGLLSEGQIYEGTMFSAKPRKLKNGEKTGELLSLNRSDDLGVVVLKRQKQPPPELPYEHVEDHSPPPTNVGQFKLSSFEEAVAANRMRTSKPETESVKLISFRFGSTSSRSTLFPGHPSGRKRVLLMQASFSEDFQRGKRIQIDKANEIARELGSYDYRFGLPSFGNSTNRIRAGRTRLIWSTKHIGAQRPTHRSMLTGKILDNGRQKRPMTSKVGIRINGKRLCLEKPGFTEGADSTEQLVYTDDEIQSAFHETCEDNGKSHQKRLGRTTTPATLYMQCALKTGDEDFLPFVLENMATQDPSMRLVSNTFQVKSIANPSKVLHILPPIIFSLPSEDGLIRTFCSVPGRISHVEIDPAVTESQGQATAEVDASELLVEMTDRFMACSVCWSPDSEAEDIISCCECGLRVHVSCHPGDNKRFEKPNQGWKCNSCKSIPLALRSENETVAVTRRCKECPVVGGAMSSFGTGWFHDVCHAWCNSKKGAGEDGQCVICSGTATKVVRCAARGCSVRFHPMCAVLVSRAAQIHRRQQGDRMMVEVEATRKFKGSVGCDSIAHHIKEADSLLTMQYELVATRVRVAGRGCSHMVYLGFCGIHNRHRLPEFFGLFPGGAFYDDAFRIPPLGR